MTRQNNTRNRHHSLYDERRPKDQRVQPANSRMRKIFLIFSFGICARAFAFGAGNPGDEVIIVYNTQMPESKEVADYYAQRRHVPTNQMFGFSLSTSEVISREEFRDKLEKPLARVLEAQKLWHVTSHPVAATTNQSSRVERKV